MYFKIQMSGRKFNINNYCRCLFYFIAVSFLHIFFSRQIELLFYEDLEIASFPSGEKFKTTHFERASAKTFASVDKSSVNERCFSVRLTFDINDTASGSVLADVVD